MVPPPTATGHQLIELGHRRLEDQHPDPSSVDIDGRRDKRGRVVERRTIELEIDEDDIITARSGDGRAEGLGEIGFAVGPFEEIGGEVGLLRRGVDHVAVGVDEQHVVVGEAVREQPQLRVELAMNPAVRARVIGCDEVVALVDRMRVAGDVVVLEIQRPRIRGQHRFEARGLVRVGVQIRKKGVGIVRRDRPTLILSELDPLELVKRGTESPEGVGHHLAVGDGLGLDPHSAKRGLELVGLGGPHRGQAIEGGGFHRRPAAEIAHDADEGQRRHHHAEDGDEHLCSDLGVFEHQLRLATRLARIDSRRPRVR